MPTFKENTMRGKVDVKCRAKRRSKTAQYVCLAPTSLEFVAEVSEDGERAQGEQGEGVWGVGVGGGVQQRGCDSAQLERESIDVESENLSFPSLPSHSVPQVGIKTQPSDGGME